MGKVSVLEELKNEVKNKAETTKFWLFPCNLQYYDVYGAFNEFDKLFFGKLGDEFDGIGLDGFDVFLLK